MPFDPPPIATWVTKVCVNGQEITSIARKWPKNTVCSRCPLSKCSLKDGICLITVEGSVGNRDAAAYRIGLVTIPISEAIERRNKARA